VAIDMSFATFSQEAEQGTAARFAHTVTQVADRLFLFGGIDFEQDFASVLVADVPAKAVAEPPSSPG
jgi:hypothetical protein